MRNKDCNRSVTVSNVPQRLTKHRMHTTYNVGQLFLNAIYHQFKVNVAYTDTSEEHGFVFDLNQRLSHLEKCRIIESSSERGAS